MSDWEPYTQDEHDEAVELGGIMLWLTLVIIVAAAIAFVVF